MLRYLRSALPAVVCVLVAASGMSYALTATEEPAPAETTTPPEEGGTVDTDPVPPVTDPATEPVTDPVTDRVVDPATDPVVDPAPEEDTGEEPEVPEEPVADAKFSTEGCPDGFAGNHGQYVSSTQERPRKDAAHSECGKPVHDDGAEDELPDETAEEGSDTDGGKDKGKNK